MKTTPPTPKKASESPGWNLIDEVIFAFEGSPKQKRMLLSTALYTMAQCAVAEQDFEVVSLDQTFIARMQNGTLSASPEVTAAVLQITPSLRNFALILRNDAIAQVRAQLLARIEDTAATGVSSPEKPSV